MKKTREDRINLIDRLERKYMEKVRMRRQEKQQNIKIALRKMRGRGFAIEDINIDYIEDIFPRGATTA